jgi:hypothetical protein
MAAVVAEQAVVADFGEAPTSVSPEWRLDKA